MARLLPPQEARYKEMWSESSVPFWYDNDDNVLRCLPFSHKGTQAGCGLKLLAH